MAKAKKVRVGFIGAGGIARHQMGFLLKMDDVEIVAAADISEASLAESKTLVPKLETFADYKEMLATAKIDAVSICTPNYLHAQPAVDAAAAGKHILVEKPMAMNAAECEAMIAAAKKKKRLLAVGFQNRFGANAQLVKRYIDEGQFGNVLYARCKALRRRGIPNWGAFVRKDLQGGGPMIDIGVHVIEVAHYLMGSPKPVSVLGNTYTFIGTSEEKAKDVACGTQNWDYKNHTVEDLAVGLVRFENGATLSIEASFAMHGKDEHGVVIMGEKAGASVFSGEIFKDEAGHMVDLTPAFLPKEDQFARKMRDWIECIQTGRASMAPAEDGLRVQQILDGVYASAETGAEVRIG